MNASGQFGSAMGGTPGDGIQNQQQTMMMPGGQGQNNTDPSTPSYSGHPSQAAATPANAPATNKNPGIHPTSGSITQFATASMAQQQQQQNNSPFNFSPPPQPAQNTAGMSYSQRAAMLQQQQPAYNTSTSITGGLYPQSQQAALYAQPTTATPSQSVAPPPQPTPTMQPATGMSYAQRSQMIQQPSPQTAAGMTYPSQQQQYQPQQQHQPGMMYGGASMMQRQQPGPFVGGGMQPSPQQQQPASNQYTGGMQPPPQQQQPVSNQYTGGMQPPPQQQQSVSNQYTGGMQPPPQQQQSVSNQYTGGMQPPPQQQQPVSNQYTGGMQPPSQQQQQQPALQNRYKPQQQQQQTSFAGGSYAQRSVMAQSSMGQPSPTAAASMASHGVIPTVGEVPVVARAVNSNQFQQPNMMPLQQPQAPRNPFEDPPEVVAQQQRLLIDATRKVQEHAYYMKQAMERNDLPAVLDRAASMVGELGEHAHSHHHHRLNPPARGATGTTTALSPKNYYELHLRALEEMPTLEDYLLNIAQGNASSAPTNNSSTMPPPQPMMQVNPKNGLHQPVSYTMKELYDCVQYSPNVLSRLYLQICAASALIRSGEVGARWVMKDLIEAVKCVQNPVRGLFLRHYLLQAFRDKLPDEAIPLDQVGPPMTPFAQQYAESLTQEEGEDAKPEATTTVTAANATSVEKGNVKDSYQFILANFIEMNKLWVRIQHLPGDGRSKDIRRRRERERNELRILVGTNMVRLSALESITSSIYGQVILPTVLDHIVISADPLAQAYLIDCITQVFPDEYHIETMPILLGVCPKLRDKVNIRTILQALMSRLTNYLSDEELLDEKDTNQVKKALARDSFKMFDECVKNVYNARGPKLQAKEVIRLQTALLSFTKKCFPENREQVVMCLNHCVLALQQASANLALMQDFQNGPSSQQPPPRVPLDPVATKELENLLSIPMDEMGLGVLTLDHYSDLIGFLPWANRRQVALTLLQAISNKGSPPESIEQLEQLFAAIAPVLRNEFDVVPSAQPTERTANLMAGLGVAPTMQHPGFQPQQSFPNGGAECREDAAMISKLIHLLNHSDTDVLYDMLIVTRNHLSQRTASAHLALVFASFKLATRILDEEGGRIETTAETKEVGKEEDAIETKEQGGEGDTAETKKEEMEKERGVTPEELSGAEEKPSVPTEKKPPAEVNAVTSRAINCRKVLIFTQETIALLSKRKPETCIKLYLEAALVADKFGKREEGEEATFGPIAQLFLSQSLSLYEANSDDSRLQSRCVVAIIGTLLACRSLGKEEYECLIMKAAQYAAKVQKKPEQCEMVALCSHLFYVVREDDVVVYSNPQRGLECLQRALKLADACTNANPANLRLFIELLDHYLFFFEKNNPSIGGNYITGLVALIKEHVDNMLQYGSPAVGEAKEHFLQIVRHIKNMKEKTESAERFASIDVSSVAT